MHLRMVKEEIEWKKKKKIFFYKVMRFFYFSIFYKCYQTTPARTHLRGNQFTSFLDFY